MFMSKLVLIEELQILWVVFSIAYTSSPSFENVPSKICCHMIGKGPKGRGFLRPICPKITRAKVKERKIERSRGKERGEEENSNYCALSFFRKKAEEVYAALSFSKNPAGLIFIIQNSWLTFARASAVHFLNLRNSFKKEVSRKMLGRSCYDSSRPFPSCF